MTAVEELKKAIDLDRIVSDITSQLKCDLNKIEEWDKGRHFPIDSSTIETVRNMSHAGLVTATISSFGGGTYRYTSKAHELYAKLKVEGFYDS